MLLRKPTRIELKPEDKEVLMYNVQGAAAPCTLRFVCIATADSDRFQLQYETVKKAQAEAQARQQAEAGQQAKFEQPQQGPKQSVATRIGYRR
ncbi:TPA: hypothetical protein ACH3X1_008081 [Trebouxia sp. C0004]